MSGNAWSYLRLVAYGFGLSAKTIINYTGFMKLVVSSAVDDNTGEPLYPRKWNHTFADMPIVHNQKQPTFSEEAMSSIAERSRGIYQVLFTLLAATGMRIGEALGLDIENIYLENRIIKIAASAWRSELQTPKTRAAVREIDMTESVVNLLREFIGDRKSGLLFKTKSGKPLGQSNPIRRHLHPLLKELGIPRTGFHAFRRFRATWLRKQGALEDLVKLWLGHAETSITDGYSKIKTDASFRRQEAKRVGIGFHISQSISASVRSVRRSDEKTAA